MNTAKKDLRTRELERDVRHLRAELDAMSKAFDEERDANTKLTQENDELRAELAARR